MVVVVSLMLFPLLLGNGRTPYSLLKWMPVPVLCAHTFYAHNVWTLIQDSCLLLRQFLSLLPPDTIIFVGAGSPCQDLTSIGRGKGVLGLVGDRSVHIHSVWALLYYLSHTAFWPRTVILVENAGSM